MQPDKSQTEAKPAFAVVRLAGWRPSASITGFCLKFPANREKYREISIFAAISSNYKANKPNAFGPFRPNSVISGTGNFFDRNRELFSGNREFVSSVRIRFRGHSGHRFNGLLFADHVCFWHVADIPCLL
jgi:hypothetical protein